MTFEEALKYLKEGKKIKKVDEVFDFLPISLDTLNEDGYELYTCDLNSEWEVVNEPLLTEEEKEYLKMIIKFHPKIITGVDIYRNEDGVIIYLKYNKDMYVDGYFVGLGYFKNIKGSKTFTLDELGLEN